jgi:predicted secreted protein
LETPGCKRLGVSAFNRRGLPECYFVYVQEAMNGNPITAVVFWIFSQMFNDPNIFPKVIGTAIILVVTRALLALVATLHSVRVEKLLAREQSEFNDTQKTLGSLRAGQRCECSAYGRRCKNAALAAKHFYPRKLGGATTMRNLIVTCRAHSVESDKTPSLLAKWRIQRRRKSYFVKSIEVTAGEWSSSSTVRSF